MSIEPSNIFENKIDKIVSEYLNEPINSELLDEFYSEVHKELELKSRKNQFKITKVLGENSETIFDLTLPSDFNKFFSQGLINKIGNDLIIMCNNSTTHYFIVKFDGKELKTVKLTDFIELDGITFCYNNEKHSLEFVCNNKFEVEKYSILVSEFRNILLRFKEDFLRSLRYMNVHLELLGTEFSSLELSEEREVYLGYTEKLFMSGNSKVMAIPCENVTCYTDIVPRITYDEKWVLKVEYGKNHKINYR